MNHQAPIRLLLACFKHETNTFSPAATPLRQFFRNSDIPLVGEAAVTARRGTGTGMGGFLEVTDRESCEITVAVVAEASPSGLVETEAYERITGLILDAARGKIFDGILLDLHGAMVTADHEDGEGELLRRLRELQPTVPIGAALDMHANLYPEMVGRLTVLSGYHTYPHTDMAAAGRRAAELLMRTIRGEIHPVLAWDNRPMLPHIMRQGTHAQPNRSLQARCIELEQSEAVLAASVFTGFPHADIRNAGLSAVVCADADEVQARRVRDELLDQAWENRSAFLYEGQPLEQSVAQAKSAPGRPVVLLDHCDNSASGGTMDTTRVLAEALRQDLQDAVFYAIRDPQAVERAIAAGVGNELTLTLGGLSELAATGDANEPITLSARVRTISDGVLRLRGPMMAGVVVTAGKTVVLQAGGIQVVVTSLATEPHDLAYLTSLGIDLDRVRYLILKSRVHWRAGFGSLADVVVECDSVGVTTSDYSKLRFERVRRPIYPLDAL